LIISGVTKTIEVVKLTWAEASAFAASNESCSLSAVVCRGKTYPSAWCVYTSA